jgi:hypothetical protein
MREENQLWKKKYAERREKTKESEEKKNGGVKQLLNTKILKEWKIMTINYYHRKIEFEGEPIKTFKSI